MTHSLFFRFKSFNFKNRTENSCFSRQLDSQLRLEYEVIISAQHAFGIERRVHGTLKMGLHLFWENGLSSKFLIVRFQVFSLIIRNGWNDENIQLIYAKFQQLLPISKGISVYFAFFFQKHKLLALPLKNAEIHLEVRESF